MNNGFITLHRKFLETSFFNDSYAVHLAITLLLKANHEPKKIVFNGKELEILRGQCIVGRHKLALETGIAEGTIYEKLKLLKNINFININSNNKFSIVTICKYNFYQDKKFKLQQQIQQPVNNQSTTSQHKQQCNNDNKKELYNISNIIKETDKQKKQRLEREASPMPEHCKETLKKMGLLKREIK